MNRCDGPAIGSGSIFTWGVECRRVQGPCIEQSPQNRLIYAQELAIAKHPGVIPKKFNGLWPHPPSL